MVLLSFIYEIYCMLIVVSCIMIISSINPVHSVFFLILVYVLSCCIVFLLKIEFIGVIFIVIYVGAIAVLFLFVVMMLNIRLVEYNQKFISYFPLGIFLAFFIIYFIYNILLLNFYSDYMGYGVNWLLLYYYKGNTELLGSLLYTYSFVNFIIAGFILLVAMIGSIVLTLSHSYMVKRQEVYKQVLRNSNTVINYYKN